MELERLKEQYAELCEMNDKGEENSDDDSSNSGHSDDESVDGYDGFACDDTAQEETSNNSV